ncbi:MAG TPA: fatty acid desaturase [Kofleriaceae bacterium]|nr:fatty acid desaturase [Kofleriaceae bacterium]
MTLSAYARDVKPHLPAAAFAPARSRALWVPVHYTIIAALAWALATGHVPWPLWPVVSLVIGCCLAGITFVGHEALHGGVVRGRTAIRIVGWLGFLPFMVSPQLWMAWHNRVHHNHTGKAGVDPDMYPTFEEYKTQRGARIMADYFGIGRKRFTGALSLLFGFTGQSLQMLFKANQTGVLRPNLHRRAIIETVTGACVWIAVGFLVGPLAFVFVYLLPLIVANTIVMTFIMTNHNLSPLSQVNDPLVNSLSVTLPRVLEWLTLDFGFHAEHHLFPTMSTRHGRVVRAVLRARFPERYQSLPLTSAIRQLHQTARVYRDDVTLFDPHTGETWPTLLPGPRPRPAAPPVVPPQLRATADVDVDSAPATAAIAAS